MRGRLQSNVWGVPCCGAMVRTLCAAGACAALLAALPLAQASAQGGAAAPGSFDGLLQALQLKARVPPAPDFVTQSRPKQAQPFIPVGIHHPERTTKVLTAAEVAATEAELDGARERQQRRAGQKPAVVPLKSRGSSRGAAK